MKPAPQLPRFSAPKRMTSAIFLSKKDKSKSRRKLNADVRSLYR